MFRTASTVAVLICPLVFLTTASPTRAALVVYEGFDMGGTAGTLSGLSGATSFGFDGSGWGSASGPSSYETTGLTLGSGGTTLQVIGGKALLAPGGVDLAKISRGLNVAITGTAWGSYLVQRVSDGFNEEDNIQVLVNQSATGHDNNAEFVISAEEYNSANGGVRGKNNPVFPSYNSGSAITTAETYLVLFKATNLAGTSGDTGLSTWILSSAQFDNWKAGGLTETELNAATTGTAATNVLQRGSLSYSPGTYPRLTAADFLMMIAFKGMDATYDEFRFSNATNGDAGGGLDQVTPVPEPTTLVLTVGTLPLLRRARRRATGLAIAT